MSSESVLLNSVGSGFKTNTKCKNWVWIKNRSVSNQSDKVFGLVLYLQSEDYLAGVGTMFKFVYLVY